MAWCKKEKVTREVVEQTLASLLAEIKEMQAHPGPQVGYKEKLLEMIYWRRRQTSLKKEK